MTTFQLTTRLKHKVLYAYSFHNAEFSTKVKALTTSQKSVVEF